MYQINFTANDDQQLNARRRDFDLLQDLIRKGFNPRTNDEAFVFGDIRRKLKSMSDESDGRFCAWCGSISRVSPTEI